MELSLGIIEFMVILCFIISLFSYGIGRRVGLREGHALGKVSKQLDLKEEYYSSGCCPLCTSNRQESS